MRVSYGAIQVMSYMLRVRTIEEVDLELVTSLYQCGCPKAYKKKVHDTNKENKKRLSK